MLCWQVILFLQGKHVLLQPPPYLMDNLLVFLFVLGVPRTQQMTGG